MLGAKNGGVRIPHTHYGIFSALLSNIPRSVGGWPPPTPPQGTAAPLEHHFLRGLRPHGREVESKNAD